MIEKPEKDPAENAEKAGAAVESPPQYSTKSRGTFLELKNGASGLRLLRAFSAALTHVLKKDPSRS